MATRSRLQIYVLAFCATLLVQSGCNGLSVHHRKHAALFIFGDSLFDVGNNNYINTSTNFQANFFPYGETFFGYSTGRVSDGRLIPDIIAEYANLPMIPPYLQPGFDNYTNGVNFASAGAGALAETFQGFVLDLKTQLGYFKNVEKQLRHRVGEAEAHTLLSEAVYLISIGSNDYIAPFIANSSLFESRSHEEYVRMVTGNLTNVIKEIYRKGGRKFGIAGMEPLGCLPGMRTIKPGNTTTCGEEINDISRLHNRVLAKVLLKLKGQLPEFIYSNPNFYSYLNDTVHNPSKHGFKEGKMACCGSGPYRGIMSCGGKRGVTEYQLCENVTDYVFFDSGHATERIYQQVSKLWWSHSTPDVTARYINLKELFEV
ncbi:PREDICTED: GDSL esterase/lipase 1-like [Fragaria vesca subsp. vesca]|uniref:GDSL esterase/lipase 1-like n=1 Tax=Fragaria vesca subsp. vesca TaxID=101020 RepID=UPI0002C329B6|nr:PREDICTED: GDSL esterase/lipase 1-like [Fragaria vesca subsp. vesca]